MATMMNEGQYSFEFLYNIAQAYTKTFGSASAMYLKIDKQVRFLAQRTMKEMYVSAFLRHVALICNFFLREVY